MRSEKEMLSLIINTAETDSNIRAAYLEGSRVNPDAEKDIFQDYDVVYIVRNTAPYIADKSWIDRFGERLYIQYPEDSVYFESDKENNYGWLMQFKDGIRLDLHVCAKEYALKSLDLYKVLIDKDGIFEKTEMLNDEVFHIKRPEQAHFSCTCNEFWWCLNNAAKGLWRNEPEYALEMIDFYIRPMLRRMLEWKIGAEYDFSVSAGKSGKYMKRYLPEKIRGRYLATYSRADIKEIWESVFTMCGLFHETAAEFGQKLNFVYDYKEAENSLKYLEHVRYLPADAKEIY